MFNLIILLKKSNLWIIYPYIFNFVHFLAWIMLFSLFLPLFCLNSHFFLTLTLASPPPPLMGVWHFGQTPPRQLIFEWPLKSLRNKCISRTTLSRNQSWAPTQSTGLKLSLCVKSSVRQKGAPANLKQIAVTNVYKVLPITWKRDYLHFLKIPK